MHFQKFITWWTTLYMSGNLIYGDVFKAVDLFEWVAKHQFLCQSIESRSDTEGNV